MNETCLNTRKTRDHTNEIDKLRSKQKSYQLFLTSVIDSNSRLLIWKVIE